ncbi:hypothetical protein ACE939_06845 [Aquimarina sp. W85]|uniref:hypothetical protein n=1 Tax=Aquimarina rhodophyticola TaxID=3342246 RepID=UPI00366E7E64
MIYKTPKVLEKKPVIGGFDLKTIVIIAACSLLFLFTVFTSFLGALFFIAVAISYVQINKKYPEKGQLKTLLKYGSSIKCVTINQPLKTIIRRR